MSVIGTTDVVAFAVAAPDDGLDIPESLRRIAR
jgi:hypothetical protein